MANDMVNAPVLEVRGLNAWRGQAHILQDVSFVLESGRLSIVGRNGMGKSTLCEALVGMLNAQSGAKSSGGVLLGGLEIGAMASYRIARAGIGYVPQGRRVFPSLSTEENLKLYERRGRAWSIERVYELLPRLAERRRTGAGRLSGGEQQMLAVGRALLTDPRVLIMDEPSEGLAPAIVDHLVEAFIELEAEGIHSLVIEQNLRAAVALYERVLVVANGRIEADLQSSRLAADPELQARYLGVF